MKKLLILVPFNGRSALFMQKSPDYICNSVLNDSFIYAGSFSPLQQVAQLISVFAPKEFMFYETDSNYVFRVWHE